MEPENLPSSNRLSNHTASGFVEAWNEADGIEEEDEIRQKLKRIDSGRWYSVLEDAHTHLAHTDLEAREHVSDLYGHGYLVWIGVYGLVEHLNTFEDVTGVSK